MRIRFHRPSAAFLLSSIALFSSLAGTGFAASSLTGGSSTGAHPASSSKPLTKQQIVALIASYIKHHRAQLRGPQGKPGARGPQGPGAVRLFLATTSAQSGDQPVASFGPWSVTLSCSPNTTNAILTVNGSGTFSATTTRATGISAGQTYVDGEAPIDNRGFSSANSNQQTSETAFLRNGKTMYEMSFVLTASSGLFESCEVMGDAFPLS